MSLTDDVLAEFDPPLMLLERKKKYAVMNEWQERYGRDGVPPRGMYGPLRLSGPRAEAAYLEDTSKIAYVLAFDQKLQAFEWTPDQKPSSTRLKGYIEQICVIWLAVTDRDLSWTFKVDEFGSEELFQMRE